MFLNVSPRRHDEFMNTSPGASGADDVDRHRQHLDAVREAGPLAIAELLGDAHYVLANLVLAPGLVFDAEEHEPGEFVQLLDRIHRSEEHTSELQSRGHLVCRLLLEKKKIIS